MVDVPPVEDLLLRLLPIVSNLGALWTSAQYLQYNDIDRAFLFTFVALFTSVVYHLCMGFPKTCFWSVSKYHVVDFWTAVLALPLIALQLIRFRHKSTERLLIWISVVGVGFLVTADSNFVGHVILGASSIGLVLLYLIWHRRVHGYWPEYDMFQLSIGVAFLLFGVVRLSLCFFFLFFNASRLVLFHCPRLVATLLRIHSQCVAFVCFHWSWILCPCSVPTTHSKR